MKKQMVRLVAPLVAFSLYVAILFARSRAGIDQIPTDPNYDFLQKADQGSLTLFSSSPSFAVDHPLIAQIASFSPITQHARIASIITHLVWASCALGIFMVVRLSTGRFIVALTAGLAIVLSPWAAQSMLGNYGNVRWPILVAALVVCTQQLLSTQPSSRVLWMSSITAALTNPLAGLLVIPLSVAWVRSTQGILQKVTAVLSAPLIVFAINLMLTGGTGHSTKVTKFWTGAGLFWLAGQLLPSALAIVGLLIFARFKKYFRENGVFGAVLLVCSIFLSALCYALGGIADRYFFGPAALSGVGILLLLHSLRPEVTIRRFLFVVVLSISLIPAAKWFSVFPWLRSGVPWSEQVQRARRECEELRRESVELVTSDGITLTNPVPCVVLASEDR
jgi:hypothetical protein